jgi:hypothetical protein
MDTSKLVVGQEVSLFGVGWVLGKVVSVFPFISVQSDEGFLQFDEEGIETDDSRIRRCGVLLNGPCPSFGPWELKSVEEYTSLTNVSRWLIKFLKSGEKSFDEIFREAKEKFGNAVGATLHRASDSLCLVRRQKERREYWSLRWILDENNRVLGNRVS